MGQTIGGLIRAEQIDLNLQAADAATAIRTVTGRLKQHPAVLNINQLYEEIIAREELSSTALTHGVAVPHARTKAVGEIVLAVGRSSTPIPFGNDGKAVRLLFVIGTPLDQIVNYLCVIGSLARMVKDSAVRECLLETDNVDEFMAALR